MKKVTSVSEVIGEELTAENEALINRFLIKKEGNCSSSCTRGKNVAW